MALVRPDVDRLASRADGGRAARRRGPRRRDSRPSSRTSRSSAGSPSPSPGRGPPAASWRDRRAHARRGRRRSPLVGVVCDEWAETVPGGAETTGITFHYDAPGARPPQSLLLAVPPAAVNAATGPRRIARHRRRSARPRAPARRRPARARRRSARCCRRSTCRDSSLARIPSLDPASSSRHVPRADAACWERLTPSAGSTSTTATCPDRTDPGRPGPDPAARSRPPPRPPRRPPPRSLTGRGSSRSRTSRPLAGAAGPASPIRCGCSRASGSSSSSRARTRARRSTCASTGEAAALSALLARALSPARGRPGARLTADRLPLEVGRRAPSRRRGTHPRLAAEAGLHLRRCSGRRGRARRRASSRRYRWPPARPAGRRPAAPIWLELCSRAARSTAPRARRGDLPPLRGQRRHAHRPARASPDPGRRRARPPPRARDRWLASGTSPSSSSRPRTLPAPGRPTAGVRVRARRDDPSGPVVLAPTNTPTGSSTGTRSAPPTPPRSARRPPPSRRALPPDAPRPGRLPGHAGRPLLGVRGRPRPPRRDRRRADRPRAAAARRVRARLRQRLVRRPGASCPSARCALHAFDVRDTFGCRRPSSPRATRRATPWSMFDASGRRRRRPVPAAPTLADPAGGRADRGGRALPRRDGEPRLGRRAARPGRAGERVDRAERGRAAPRRTQHVAGPRSTPPLPPR